MSVFAPSLTNRNFFDELGGSVHPLHKSSGPRRQVPVSLHSEDVGLYAPPGAGPGGEHQVRTLGWRTLRTSRVDQSAARQRRDFRDIFEVMSCQFFDIMD